MKNILIFFTYCFLIILLSIISKRLLMLDDLIYSSLTEKLTQDQIYEFLNFQKKWEWVSYAIVPIVLAIKTTLVASVLYIGTFFFSRNAFSFKKLLAIVVKSEFVFLPVVIFKIIWFYFFKTNYTLEDIQYFYPLSALNIVGYQGLEPWFIYPFQVLNLFELAYWLILAFFIGKSTETNMDNGLKIVASSYGSSLLLWVVTIMFFTLNYS